MDSLLASVLFFYAVGIGSLIGIMVLAMPETFIKPVQAAFFGLHTLLK